MKGIYVLYIVAVVVFFAICLTVRGQSVIEVYGPTLTPDRRVEATQYHFCQARFNGTEWNDQQKTFLDSMCADPVSMKSQQMVALTLFSQGELRANFQVGSFDTSILKAMYRVGVLSDKAVYLRSLSMNGKAALWRPWIAYWAMTHRLTQQQKDSFDHFTQFFNNPSPQHVRELELEAIAAFGVEGVKQVYGPIGPYASVGQVCGARKPTGPHAATAKMQPNCGCSVGSYFNWSCSGTCNDGTGTCTRTDDGCGFAGLYNCDGGCKTGDAEIQSDGN